VSSEFLRYTFVDYIFANNFKKSRETIVSNKLSVKEA
jgi:hypothetical protein